MPPPPPSGAPAQHTSRTAHPSGAATAGMMLPPGPATPHHTIVERGCQKKTRLVWTPELHTRFLFAVEQLGLRTAVPRTILQVRTRITSLPRGSSLWRE